MAKSNNAGDPDPHPDGKAPDSESQELTRAKKVWLRDLPPMKERYKEPTQLPNWVKLAMARHELGYHDTWKEAAEEQDKTPGTLYNYRSTPAGKKYLARFEGVLDDPAKLSENLLRGELHTFTLDFITMWEEAKDANDYAEIRKMWESVMDRVPGSRLGKKGDIDVGQATITVNFGSPEDLEPEIVETEYEEIEADVELLDD